MREKIIVRGGGDVATGTIYKLYQSGFAVLILETEHPSAIRRNAAFSEAVYEGKQKVEDVTCYRAENLREAEAMIGQGKLVLLVDPKGDCIEAFQPFAVIDAILAKRNLGTNRAMAKLTVGLGPGFSAGEDVDVVVETMRGNRLGRLIYEGSAIMDTKIPGNIGGYTKERVIHAPADGWIHNICHITDMVNAGQQIAVIRTPEGEVPVTASIPGLLRGLIREGYPVTKGFKIADIDPRTQEYENCFLISDKARCIAGGVLEAVLRALNENRPSEKKQGNTLYERVLAQFHKEGKETSVLQKEWFQPQPQLVICGGGHVAIQLAKMAKMIDFYVHVIDDREEFANFSNFPDVDKVDCHSYEHVEEIFPEEEHTYYVVVTRGHAGDLICVEQILRRGYDYLGMIGSRAKVAKTFETLIAEGFDKERVMEIHAPIGLAIKAQTPAEIAVSIMAEIIACKNEKGVSSMTRDLNQTQEKGVLCIITEKSGSSPRGAGSMMLVKQDGTTIGSIGGGAIEHAAIRHARTVSKISEGSYDLSNRESAELGMICGGRNRVLFVPVS